MSWDVSFQWPSVHGARVVTRTAVDLGSGETIYFVSTAGGLEERVPEKHMAFDVKRDTTTFTTRLRASEGGRHVKRLKLRRSLGGTGSPMRSLPPRKLELRRLSPNKPP